MIVAISGPSVYIYTLEDKLGNVRYVGKTNDISARLLNHLADVTKNVKTHKTNWIKSLLNKGERPIINVLDEVPLTEWHYWEKYWIQQVKSWGFNLVNHCEGGEGLSFGNQTSFKKGASVWNKGKTYSNSKKGYVTPDDVRLQISATLTGRASLKKKKVKQFNKNMEFIKEYPSITEASAETGIKGIRNVVTGKVKTAGGFIWQS